VSRRDEVEHLMKRSKEFLETSEYQIRSGFYGLAVFSLEQALQLYLKSRILANGVEYPKTRSVRSLLEMLSDLSMEDRKPAIRSLLDRYLLELGMLEDAYITSRYVMREFKREEAERLLDVVKRVMEDVA
jgi:HEPN domain-containing protein